MASWTAIDADPMIRSMKSMLGTAQAKISWKKVTITAAKSSDPHKGCRTTRSIASVNVFWPRGRVMTWEAIESAQAPRSYGSSGGGIAGRDQSDGSAIRSRKPASP